MRAIGKDKTLINGFNNLISLQSVRNLGGISAYNKYFFSVALRKFSVTLGVTD